MAKELLTTLDHVKLWLGVGEDDEDNDKLLLLLISGASAFVLNYLNRDHLAVRQYVEVYDTYGKNWLMLKHYPAHSVSQVYFCGQTLTAQATFNPRTNGIFLQDAEQAGGCQRVTLFGYCFPYGMSSTEISYMAGYQTTETIVIPTADPPR